MMTLPITQALEADFTNQPPTPTAPTEGEAVALAAEALRELVETKYPYTERVFRILGQERIPPAIKADMARRERLLAAAAVLEGMVKW